VSPGISGARTFVDIFFDSRNQIRALYDTGAGVTILGKRAYNIAVKAGCVGEEILDHGVALSSASGSAIDVVKVVWLTMTIQDKKLTGPVVVSDGITNTAILGMNIIRKYGMSLDPKTGRVRFDAEKAEPDFDAVDAVQEASKVIRWNKTEATARYSITIQPASVAKVECIVRNEQGETIPKGQIGVVRQVIVNGEEEVAESVQVIGVKGVVSIFIVNNTDKPMVVTRGAILADVTRWSKDEGIRQVTLENLDEVVAETCETEGITVVQTDRKTKKCSPEKRQRIHKFVFGQHQTRPWAEKYEKLLVEFHDVISDDKHDLGRTDTMEHPVDTRHSDPAYTKQFPIPAAHMDLIKENLRQWLKLGLIEPANSPWNSPIFCVRKKEGHGLRVVLDYRRVNMATIPERYSIRTVEDCIAEVGKNRSTVFSSLDLTSGFWQVPMRMDDKHLTAFTIPGTGSFQWIVCPMGLTGAPATFARLMDAVMANLQGVITYIDDVLVHT
jgi:predicted aspartyl protease